MHIMRAADPMTVVWVVRRISKRRRHVGYG